MSFSWVPFYRELAGKVLEFEDRQDELIGVLREMQDAGLNTIRLKDYDAHNNEIELGEIDPFTFFASWNRGNDKKGWDVLRRDVCHFIGEKWEIKAEIPQDFSGVPTAFPTASWFIAYEQSRLKDDVPALWKVAREVVEQGLDGLTNQGFSRALQVKQVALPKLTMGLFWLAPHSALALDQLMVSYLGHKGVSWNKKALVMPLHELDVYRQIVQDVHAKLGTDHPKISYDALKWNGYGIKDAPSIALETIKMPTIPTLNQILYGPPGTGKTYNSIRRAVQIIDKEVGDDPKARFEELRKAGQIEFVTFHQSFSYEEFIEGLRPLVGEENGQVSYEIRPGILKKIALEAIGEGLEKADTKRATFEQVWNAFLEKVEDESWLLPGIGTSKYKVIVTAAGNITGENVNGNAQQPYNGSRSKIEKIWEKLRDGPVATHALIIGILRVGSHSNLIGAVVEELKRIEAELPKSQFSSAPVAKSDIAAHSFLSGSADYRANFDAAKHYVLIIDEINRGNISKILGELITLLEDDKRIGAPNELRLTLPTSGETFALPPNLWILGTMNTSDKSLAQLDVALRRRFDFEEMAPELWRCDKLDGLPEVLTQLNERLEWALDREHRLGHAYFMSVDSQEAFDAVFQSKILPLLLEYFPHDFATLRSVLGEESDGFLREMVKPRGFSGGGKKYRWWFETGAQDFSAFEQLKANYGL